MKLRERVREYLCGFSPSASWLLFVGVLEILFAVCFLLGVLYLPGGLFGYGVTWLRLRYAFWLDSIGVSILLLLGGAILLDYAVRFDGR